jgi:hypothetical protein
MVPRAEVWGGDLGYRMQDKPDQVMVVCVTRVN